MKQSYETIIYEKRDKIARITFNRPEVRNAINLQLIREYLAALDAADNDPEVAVIILTGAGSAFSSGEDLKAAKEHGANAQRAYLDLLYYQMHDKILSLSKPIIAMVNGPAREAGCTVAFACDMIIAADSASFAYPAITIGIPPGIHIWHAQRIAGKMKATPLIFTGEVIGAAEAERIGLISKVVPAKQLEKETLAIASKIAKLSPLTLKLTRELFYRVHNMDFRTAVRTISDVVSLSFETYDSKEGRKAWNERREPIWQGR